MPSFHTCLSLLAFLWVALVQLAMAHPASLLQQPHAKDNTARDDDGELLPVGSREAQVACVKPSTPAWCEAKGHGAKLTCVTGISWFCQWTDPMYGSPAYALTNMTCEGCSIGS